MPPMIGRLGKERLETELSSIFDGDPHLDPRRAVETVEEVDMVPVLAHPDGRLLLMDPYSATHYLFSPTGPHGEYESREHADDIVVGEEVPDRLVRHDWEPLDRDWRARVTNGSLEPVA